MSGSSDFIWFATGSSATVRDQADYASAGSTANGFGSGILASLDLDKALRQASMGSALLGDFISTAGLNATDNGNLATMLTNFQSALAALNPPGFSHSQIATGSGTFTVPANITKVKARVWGGGGGSGGTAGPNAGGAGGGGGGGYAEKICSVTPGQVIAITVGAPGSAANAGGAYTGGTGGSSSFGSFCSASGGSGGSGNTSGNGGQGGGGSGGDINMGGGGGSTASANSGQASGGCGGTGAAGGGGGSGALGTSTGGSFPAGGGGGPGSGAGTNAGTAGAGGLVVLEY